MPVINKTEEKIDETVLPPSENTITSDKILRNDSFYIKRIYPVIKRIFDLVVSIIAVIVLSPVFIITAVAVAIESPGNVIHKRICYRNGKEFVIYKFRSMVIDADDFEKHFSPEQLKAYRKEIKLEEDPRITRVGKFIRKTSIDELPQLFNIIQGKMSLVGPRPIIKEEVKYYGDKQNLLFSVKPGLTGHWQVNGRSKSTYESGERQKLELYYAKNRCCSLDLKILFLTVGAVLRHEGAK